MACENQKVDMQKMDINVCPSHVRIEHVKVHKLLQKQINFITRHVDKKK